MPLLLPSVALAFFALGCIFDGGFTAWRCTRIRQRLSEVLAENERLRQKAGEAVPAGEDYWS